MIAKKEHEFDVSVLERFFGKVDGVEVLKSSFPTKEELLESLTEIREKSLGIDKLAEEDRAIALSEKSKPRKTRAKKAAPSVAVEDPENVRGSW